MLSKVGFIGKEQDEESSYFQLGVRQYDPAIGRFLSVDPLWEYFPNYNPYHYSYNNPVSFKDPTGLAPEKSEKEDEILSSKEDEVQDNQYDTSPIHPYCAICHERQYYYTDYFRLQNNLWAFDRIQYAMEESAMLGRAGGGGSMHTGGGLGIGSPGGGRSDRNTGAAGGSSNGTPRTTIIQEDVGNIRQLTDQTCWLACLKEIIRLKGGSQSQYDKLDAFYRNHRGSTIFTEYKSISIDLFGTDNVKSIGYDSEFTPDKTESIIYDALKDRDIVMISYAYKVDNNDNLCRHAMIIKGMRYEDGVFKNYIFSDPFITPKQDEYTFTGRPLWLGQENGENRGVSVMIPAIATQSPGAFYFIYKR